MLQMSNKVNMQRKKYPYPMNVWSKFSTFSEIF